MATGISDTVHVVDPASVMRLLPGRPRVLALGEPTHGEDLLLEVRNELFQQLVEREGYRTIAIESDCLRGLLVDEYVTSGTGSIDHVMDAGFSHGFGAGPANRALVEWMRSYNDGRPASEQVHFAGFDGPLEIMSAASPRQALTALHDFLTSCGDADLLPCTAAALDELVGDDDRWTNTAAAMDPSQSVGQTVEASQLRLIADDLVALLDAQAPVLIAASSREDWDRARLHGRTATGLLRYHHWMADTSPRRMAWLLGGRASMMAANLLDLAERGPVLVHAGNGHLQRDKSSMRLGQLHLEWWSAGAIVDAALGADYAVMATALGTIHHHGVEAPPANTVEGHLYALPEDRYVVDSRRLAHVLADAAPVPRESPWYGYAGLDPAHLPGYDALVFVKDVPAGKTWWPAG